MQTVLEQLSSAGSLCLMQVSLVTIGENFQLCATTRVMTRERRPHLQLSGRLRPIGDQDYGEPEFCPLY